MLPNSRVSNGLNPGSYLNSGPLSHGCQHSITLVIPRCRNKKAPLENTHLFANRRKCLILTYYIIPKNEASNFLYPRTKTRSSRAAVPGLAQNGRDRAYLHSWEHPPLSSVSTHLVPMFAQSVWVHRAHGRLFPCRSLAAFGLTISIAPSYPSRTGSAIQSSGETAPVYYS